MMKSITSPSISPVLMIVSHSHWDREWHMSFQQFRIKLGQMIDSLLNILEARPDFRCFMLDGQAILLEDYAELRPERVEELRSAIRSGRILVGPWYVLPDEFLVSGEAIIRNLLVGKDVATAFGGYMKVGYLPDQFGHIAQMPQILRSFGLTSAVLWRGVDDDALESTEFNWRAPDGSGVLAINIPDGYFNAGGLPTDTGELSDRIHSIVGRLAPLGNTQFLLLMNGGDHAWPQPKLPTIVSAIKGHLHGIEVRHSNLPAYVDAVERALAEKGVQMEVITGELRRCKTSHLLPGVLSTRMWIKQRNAACETLLEKWVEPFTAWAWIECATKPKTSDNGSASDSQHDTGLPHGTNWRMPLHLAWKYLLQNQPHDSICGCSIDQVHEEMRVRYDWVEQIGEMMIEEALQELSGRIDTASITGGSASTGSSLDGGYDETRRIVVFNPLPETRTDMASFEAHRADEGFLAIDDSGSSTPCQVLENVGNGKLRFGFVAGDVPGIGFKTYRLQPQVQTCFDARPPLPPKAQIENEFFVVTANEIDGTFDVLDRGTGQVFPGLNRFSDNGDAGDEYNLDCPLHDTVIMEPATQPEVEVIETGPTRFTLQVRSVLRMPREISSDRKSRSAETVSCPLATSISLYPGVKRIEVTARVENLAKDHRLRVLFPTGVRANDFYTETQFDVLKRDLPVAYPRPDWVEDPVTTQPQKSFVDVNDGDRGLLIANRGLPECEVSPGLDGLTIGLTLLRCVGWLSRGDLTSRRGNAGPELPTPGAQCPGTHYFNYAIAPHDGNWQDASSQAHQFNTPLRAVVTGSHAGSLPARLSFISIVPGWVQASAVKPSHDARALIVRLYNPTSNPVNVQLRSSASIARAELVDSKEEPVGQEEQIGSEGSLKAPSGAANTLQMELSPKGITTMKLYYWE